MMIATVVGMVGGSIVAVLGLINFNLLLFSIGGFGFYNCWKQRQMLREMGPEEQEDQIDYSAAYEPQTPRRQRSRQSMRAAKKLRQQAMEARLEQEAHPIRSWQKVSAQGMSSLSWSERRALRKATQHRRKRDMELTR